MTIRILCAAVPCLTLASVLSVGAPARETPPADAVKADGGSLDLMAGYWRHHFTFSPARISPEDLAKDVAANVDGLADRVKKSGVDLKKPSVGWPFYYEFVYSGHGESSPLTLLVRSAPPPADRMRPDFNDSGWQRLRLPFTAGRGRTGNRGAYPS